MLVGLLASLSQHNRKILRSAYESASLRQNVLTGFAQGLDRLPTSDGTFGRFGNETIGLNLVASWGKSPGDIIGLGHVNGLALSWYALLYPGMPYYGIVRGPGSGFLIIT